MLFRSGSVRNDHDTSKKNLYDYHTACGEIQIRIIPNVSTAPFSWDLPRWHFKRHRRPCSSTRLVEGAGTAAVWSWRTNTTSNAKRRSPLAAQFTAGQTSRALDWGCTCKRWSDGRRGFQGLRSIGSATTDLKPVEGEGSGNRRGRQLLNGRQILYFQSMVNFPKLDVAIGISKAP